MAKTILITGSSAGFGKAVAECFAAKGWNVAATMRDLAKGEVFAGQDNIKAVLLDVTKPETIQPAVDESVGLFGTIDVLFNNVGYGSLTLFEESSDESFRHAFETNFFGHLNVMRAVLPVMRRQKSGFVINVTSLAGLFGIPMQTSYCASKFAMTGFTETIKWELMHQGIDATVLEVGAMKTEFSAHMSNSRVVPVADYDAYLERMRTVIKGATKKFQANAAPAEEVAESVYKLVQMKKKPFRYHPTKDGRLISALKRVLPDSMFRRVSVMGLDQ